MTSTEPKNQSPAMTDAEVRTALWAAGVPGIYHRKEMNLQTLQTPAAAMAIEWIGQAKASASLGDCASITFDGKMGMDLTYLLVRGMTLQGCAIKAVSLPTLAEITANRFALRNADILEDMHGRDYLMVVGALGGGQAPYQSERMFEMEWVMRNWILSGKPLMLQGDCEVAECKWWTQGFCNLFMSHQTYTFADYEKRTRAGVSIPQPKSAGGKP